MKRNFLCILAAWLVATSNFALASSRRITPEFGVPIVVADRVIFTAPGRPAHRLICIDKEHGKKLWDITDTNRALEISMVLGDQLLVMAGADLCACDIKSGSLSVLYRTGLEYADPRIHYKELLLFFGARTNVDYLTAVDTTTWRMKWEVPRITYLVADGRDVVLCGEGTQVPFTGGGYTVKDERLVAISKSDGRVLWHRSRGDPSCGAVIGDFFLLCTNSFFTANISVTDDAPLPADISAALNSPRYITNVLSCLKQSDGTAVKEVSIRLTSTINQMATENGRLLTCPVDLESEPYCLSFSVPGLEAKKIAEKEWYPANCIDYVEVTDGRTRRFWKSQFQNSIADGYFYFGDLEADRIHTTLNRVELKTGHREKLYEETVPPELQFKPRR